MSEETPLPLPAVEHRILRRDEVEAKTGFVPSVGIHSK